jgi:hypothetical protein
MKVPMSDKIRRLQGSPTGAKALRDFIATAKINEVKEIKVADAQGHEQKITVKLVPSQG